MGHAKSELRDTLECDSKKYLVLNALGVEPSVKYDVDDEALGEGGFGVVKKVRTRQGNEERALKIMAKRDIPDVDCLLNEIGLQAKMDHPNICRIYETFEDHVFIEIVLEACNGGDVFCAIHGEADFCEPEAFHIFDQLVRGIAYMHGKAVVHRDLKPENLLVKEADVVLKEATVKIIDFGFAREFSKGTPTLFTQCGTPDYLAPEILVDDEPYNEKCDIWSAGVILYYFLCGELPFAADSIDETFEKARSGHIDWDESWSGKSPNAKLLVVQMLLKSFHKRPDAMKIRESPWMKAGAQKELPAGNGISSISRMRKFCGECRLKQMSLNIIARMVDDKEITALRDAFVAMDTDASGTITKDEMINGLRESDDLQGISPSTVDEIFSTIGKSGGNSDGYIDYSEFIAANMRKVQYLQERCCWEAFQTFDKDGDGKLSREDLREMLADNGPLASKKVDLAHMKEQICGVIDHWDVNGDGKIDWDEFMQMLQGGEDDSATGRGGKRCATVADFAKVKKPKETSSFASEGDRLKEKENEGWQRKRILPIGTSSRNFSAKAASW